MTWSWPDFHGSAEALRYARRDLACLDAIVARVPGRTAAVQAGGSLGIFPKRLAEVFETVYTFEPAPDAFSALVHNAPAPNIVKMQAALGEARQLVGLSRSRRKPGRAGAVHEGLTHVDGPGVVPTLRIDDLALPACDLICLDLEGYELYALRGAVETIHRCRPVIAAEVNQHIGHYGHRADDVHDLMRVLGYRHVSREQSDDVFLPSEVAA